MTATRFQRRPAVARLLAGRRDLLVVSGLGAPSYDVAAAGDHERNFYLWGAMGSAALVGLGLALAQPKVPVLVVTGDGEMLMGLGGLATVALRNPGNLSIVVLDNGLYGETGGQESHTSGPTDLRAVARGCGIADARTVTSETELAALATRAHAPGNGTVFARIPIDPAPLPRILPPRDGVFLKNRMRSALGLSPL
ncbi:aldehyde dehydrogenase [Hypericibacter terrae]|uniref:Aldehyde dehydrogenase n=1 Tax=Hypericibacter terrae TaxID=2602015 RepID=A0A5J6MTX1_9PROT|nr:thiamine pyrophosphate-dependent enzyme [Hypericibacter terrae]QEX19490.1 aldehyde dehydrogenase [Hypericibacter terrae]